jgi:hypothetical protein
MGRRHLLVFALLIFSVAAAHAAWQAWDSYGRPAPAVASPGSASKVCTACGMKEAQVQKQAAKKPHASIQASDINGLEPYEVDTPRTPLISPTVEGFVPPTSARPSN